jgi:hypothetical protein
MDRFARIAEVLEVPGSFFLSADGKATSPSSVEGGALLGELATEGAEQLLCVLENSNS